MLAARRTRHMLAMLVAAALPVAAHAQTIDFDDYVTSGYEALGAYAGMSWTNTFVLRAGTSFASVAAASSPNVIFPGFGSPSGFALSAPGTFTLGSIDLVQWDPFNYGYTAPSTTVRGFLLGAPVAGDVMTVALGSTYATTVFNWAGIDAVTFTQENGDGWYVADNVVLGNVAVTATPEPATLALVGGGLAALGIGARRRRRA
ncbi:MAG: PEP-CTERM sorting domain-containing protein [Gemmatirosa sp.]|nr:PEP-CTERM sorting domain-containing protein [Gemmatirosa sp.]